MNIWTKRQTLHNGRDEKGLETSRFDSWRPNIYVCVCADGENVGSPDLKSWLVVRSTLGAGISHENDSSFSGLSMGLISYALHCHDFLTRLIQPASPDDPPK